MHFHWKKNIFVPILVFMDIILLTWKPGFRMNITRNKGLKEGRGGGGPLRTVWNSMWTKRPEKKVDGNWSYLMRTSLWRSVN